MENGLTKGKVRESIFDRGVSDSFGVHYMTEIYCPDTGDYLEWLSNLEITLEQFRFSYRGMPVETISYLTAGEVKNFFDIEKDATLRVTVIVFNRELDRRKFLAMNMSEREESCKSWWTKNKELYLGMLNNHIKENNLYVKRK